MSKEVLKRQKQKGKMDFVGSVYVFVVWEMILNIEELIGLSVHDLLVFVKLHSSIHMSQRWWDRER